MSHSPAEKTKFKTVRGLLIADTLLRDVPPGAAEAAEFVGFEESAQREWIIQVYRDDKKQLTGVYVVDSAQVRPGGFSVP